MSKYYNTEYDDTTDYSDEHITYIDDTIYGSGGGGCFAYNTLVRTTKGATAIQHIRPNDMVIAYDKYGNLDHGLVTKIFSHDKNNINQEDIYTFYVSEGINNYYLPDCTGNHALYNVLTNEHSQAKTFAIGDSLVNIHGNEVQITSIVITPFDSLPEDYIVYNLEISPQHTYFVGEGGNWIRVHNGGGDKGAGAARTAVEAANTLQASTIASILEIISEGPIVGIVGGTSSATGNIFSLGTSTLTSIGGALTTLNSSTKNPQATTTTYDVGCYTQELLYGSSVVRWRFNTPTKDMVCGLSSNTSSIDKANIAFGIKTEVDSTWSIYENGAVVATSAATHDDKTIFSVEYVGTTITYKRDNATIHTSTTTAGRTFVFMASLASPGASVNSIETGVYVVGRLPASLQGVYFNQNRVQNLDGTNNFQNVYADIRLGLPDQTVIPGFDSIKAVGTSTQALITVLIPKWEHVLNTNVDAISITLRFPNGLSEQNITNGDLNGYAVEYAIDTRPANGTWSEVLRHTVKGKAVSSYEISHKVYAPAASWDFQIRRITPIATSSAIRDLLYFAAYVQIVESKLTYPNTAVVGITVTAESVGNSVPSRGYDVKGLIIQVPVNYDPILATYTGNWNGTFKYEWTDNPAWVLYDLITNPRYGVDSYLNTTVEVDKWAFYECAVYNDGLVPDGTTLGDGITPSGALERRYTFNAVIQTQQDAWQLLHAVASTMRANIAMAGNLITVIQDRPSSPVKIITNSNVIEGLFSYSSTNSSTRATSVNVTFSEMSNLYLPRVITEFSASGIAKYGVNSVDLVAYGIVSESGARRLAKWVLYTSLHQTNQITFAMSLNIVDLSVGDVVSVMDNDFISQETEFKAGRIVSNSGGSIVLDSPVELTGTGWVLGVNNVAYTGIDEVTLLEGTGTYTTVTFAGVSTEDYTNHEYYIYKIGTIVPSQYKISSIVESSRGIYTLTGLFYEPSKYDEVEFGIIANPSAYTEILTRIPPPTGLTVTEHHRTDGVLIRSSIVISWDINEYATSFILGVRKGATDYVYFPGIKANFYEFVDVLPSVYDISLQAVGFGGRKSLPVYLTYTYRLSPASTLLPPTNLYVTGTTGTVFAEADLSIIWDYDAANDTKVDRLKDYIAVVSDDTGIVIHNSYVIPYDTHASHDKGGTATYPNKVIFNDFGYSVLPRSFRVDIYSRDVVGNVSLPIGAVFSNPAPAALTGLVITGFDKIITVNDPTYVLPSDGIEAIIAVGSVSTFDPSDRASWFFKGPAVNNITATASGYASWYVKVAITDNYNNGTLNWSNAILITTVEGGASVVFTTPDVPTGLSIAATTHTQPTGEIVSDLQITWDANIGQVSGYTFGYLNFSLGETQFNYIECSSNFLTVPNVLRGTVAVPVVYRAIVRANLVDQHSAFSAQVNVSLTGDTTATGPISALTSTTGFDTVALSWVNPTDSDYKLTEIWFTPTTDNRALATKVIEITGTSTSFPDLVPGQSGYFWGRAVDTSGNFSTWYPVSATAGVFGSTSSINMVNFRTEGAPSNQPVIGAITASAVSAAGLVDITLTWTYTQGTLKAESFAFYALPGVTDPSVTDPAFTIVSGNVRTYTFLGIPVENSYRVGIVAGRTSVIGYEHGAIVNSWVRTGVANNLANFTSVGAPNGAAPTIGTITASTATSAGLTDITVNWAYTDGTLKADNFILYIESGTTTPTLASLANVMVNGDKRSYTWLGVPVENSYTVGIACVRTYSGGIQSSVITNSWTRTGVAADITATISGTSAATVVSNAAGAAATTAAVANSTATVVPTNAVTITVTTIAATAQSATGTVDLTVSWNYTQGAVTADTFLIYAVQGTTAPTTASPLVATVSGDLRSYTFFGVPVDLNYRAGIVATRTSAAGVSYPKTIVTGWTRTGVAATITGTVATAATTATWTNVTSRPTSLATLNSTDGTKLTGIAAGATVNTGAFATLAGTITAANNSSYFAASSMAELGGTLNTTNFTTTQSVSGSVNPNGKPTIINFGVSLLADAASGGGYNKITVTLMRGAVTLIAANQFISLYSASGGQQQTSSMTMYLDSTVIGVTATWTATFTYSKTTVGSTAAGLGSFAWISVQAVKV